MTVRVIDCETTGTDAAVDAVIEIASVDVLADGTIANRQEALICPPIPVPPEASAIHHLLYQDLTGKPALRDVLPAFQGADRNARCAIEHRLGGARHLAISLFCRASSAGCARISLAAARCSTRMGGAA